MPVYGVEVWVSPYRPVLSDDPEVQAVRNKVFEDNNWFRGHPLQFGVEFDRYILNQYGLFGFYAKASYWRQTANARVCRDADGTVLQCTSTTILTSEVGADQTAINVVPVGLGAVYRYDMLRRNSDIPLVLSGKVGLDYFVWWSTQGNSASRLGGGNGPIARGGTIGMSASVQVAFPLDALKRAPPIYGTREAKQNNYIFLEYTLGYAPGLFQKQPRFDMSDLARLTLGLSIDMS